MLGTTGVKKVFTDLHSQNKAEMYWKEPRVSQNAGNYFIVIDLWNWIRKYKAFNCVIYMKYLFYFLFEVYVTETISL
jgi:hypothetical protein